MRSLIKAKDFGVRWVVCASLFGACSSAETAPGRDDNAIAPGRATGELPPEVEPGQDMPSEQDAVDATPARFTDLSEAEVLGGQSGVEGDGCYDPDAHLEEVALDEVVDGITASDLLTYVAGTHSAQVRWASVDPPNAAGDEETLNVEVSVDGPVQAMRSLCGQYFEIPVQFRAHSDSGALDFGGSSRLSATRDFAGLSATFALADAEGWRQQVESTFDLGTAPSLELAIGFSPAGVSGSLAVRGAGMCVVAQWATETCRIGVDDPEYGVRVRELVDHLEQAPPTWSSSQLRWTDDTVTQVQVELASKATTACVYSNTATDELVHHVVVSVDLRVVTADGRLDVVLPAQLYAAVNADVEWSRFSFTVEAVALPDELGHFDVGPFAEGDRVVVTASSDGVTGGIVLKRLTPRSSALREIVNIGCASAPFINEGRAQAGTVTDLIDGWWQ
jgi:hypothetical protein